MSKPAKTAAQQAQGPVIPVTEVNLVRVPRALEGEVRGEVVASRGRVRGGCGVKVAVRG